MTLTKPQTDQVNQEDRDGLIASHVCDRTRSVHVWGFFDDAGNRCLSAGIAGSAMTVADMHNQVVANITHHGGTITECRSTRTLSGWLVGTQFLAPEHGDAAAIWHVISEPRQEPWPAPKVEKTPSATVEAR